MKGQSVRAWDVRRPPPRPSGARRRVRPVWRPTAVLPLLLAAVVLLGGCGAMGSERAEEPAGEGETAGAAGIPETARIVCGPEGTRVLTPRVRARPDGVHLVIDNRFDAEAGYAFKHPEGEMGDGAPRGESSHVWDPPPGEIRVGCEKPPVDGIGTDYATLKVVAGDSGYKPIELECQGGMAVAGGAQYAPGARGVKGDLVGQARSQFSEKIREDDVVELAGYPELRDERIVRVVRDGRVIATVHFLGEPGDWLQDRYEACESF